MPLHASAIILATILASTRRKDRSKRLALLGLRRIRYINSTIQIAATAPTDAPSTIVLKSASTPLTSQNCDPSNARCCFRFSQVHRWSVILPPAQGLAAKMQLKSTTLKINRTAWSEKIALYGSVKQNFFCFMEKLRLYPSGQIRPRDGGG